ncbi:hypothetical protein [Maioricimonas sp. JC845]|uniref:hypothetical protein n=1 Tax=Maioricimonas sp. JC845 TaxID=3232138 RepID=UPI003458E1B0
MNRPTLTLLGALLFGMLLTPSSGHAQVRIGADWLFLSRDNDSDAQLISGPNAVSSGEMDFDYESGYRLNFGVGLWEYELDASWTELPEWSSSQGGTMTAPFVFDDTAGNAVVVPVPPGNTFAFNNAMFDATTSMVMGAVEANESEQLHTGAVWQLYSESRYDDFEINLGTNREQTWYRVSFGYRHVRFDERAGLSVSGIFDALDSDDGAVFGDPTNEANDGLSNGALIGAGFINIDGAADGYSAFDVMGGASPDTVTVLHLGAADNRLDGGQMTFAGRLFPSDYVIVEGILKAGLYRNKITAAVSEVVSGSVNDDSVYARTLRDERDKAAFVGTVGATVMVPVTEYITIRGGYEATFLTGIGLAAEQTARVATDALGNAVFSADGDGVAIIHGGVLGLELFW